MLTALILAALATPPSAAQAKIRGSIEATLTRKVGSDGPALAAQVARLLRWRGDVVHDVHPRDELSLLWETDDAGEPILVALTYRGAELELEAHRFTDASGVARYYDPDGLLVEPMLEDHPVPDYEQITEDVQSGRGRRTHNGIDLKAEEGTPIYLPYDATVYRVNWLTHINGNCLEVKYRESGIFARFLHLDAVASGLRPGQTLRAGTEIGTVGNTGRSSAPHLHYELRTSSGVVLRPVEVHGTRTATVAPDRGAAFRATVERNRRVLAGGPLVSL